ncbi:isochorismatase family protein [Planctomyces sp. SH-PL62]|uniref:isochorismatase family protein n=1 Tax=Planctomyces sp. SH-PL62 TaxID=1636152 RepID=UPI00078BC791|nr:isochorismatase family protein [Planctomyces sp. SH-PL62]AMV38074.1 Isochorismatase family protein [Planctomyces sp. SH-PL62]
MRATQRLTAAYGALLVIDVQEKLVAAVADGPKVVANTLRLIRGAKLLDVAVQGTEQYPKGLGPTSPPIAELIPERASKMTFACCSVPQILEQYYGRLTRHVTLAGLEAHVCVAQTALDLIDLGFRVQVPADAVASRNPFDRDVALRRLESAGAVISTTEAVLFEWCATADRPEFKALSALVKEPA